MDDAQVFKALADPTRRHLLDRLFERDGRTLIELESGLEMTRFGVMKHLKVLEEAGLVVTRRRGREKLHYLNPVPIRLIHDRWIDKYTERRVSALVDLKHDWSRRHDFDDGHELATQVYQVFIKATPEADLGRDHEARVHDQVLPRRARRDDRRGRHADAHVRARRHDLGRRDHRGVRSAAPARRGLALAVRRGDGGRARAAGSPGRSSRVTDGTCLVTLVHDQLEHSPLTAQSVSGEGWMGVLSGLKTLLETGRPMR